LRGWSNTVAEIEAVSFKNAQGLTLFGSLHSPKAPKSGLPLVVLLSPGVKMRVGPGRLYVPLTELLVSLGHRVLRFDFYGLGDSEGDLTETLLADVYNNIEVGRYVDDTVAALDWAQKRLGTKRFLLGGLCGGALTGILAAERDSRVEGLLSLGMTVTLASNAARPGQYLTRAQLDDRRARYFQKLLSPKAWLRFFSFKSEYGVIWRAVKRLFVKDKPAPAPVISVAAAAAPADAPIEQRGNANPLFPKAYFAFLQRGGKALMLFSEKDRLGSEYQEKFCEPYAAQLQPFLAQIDQHVIPEANHVLSFREWQVKMLEHSRAWLTRLYPSAT
jgi:pimeloyl-ACP methyl ester carboxylesterase